MSAERSPNVRRSPPKNIFGGRPADPRGTGRSPRVSARIRAEPRRKVFRRANSPFWKITSRSVMISTVITFYAPEKCSSLSHRPFKITNLMNTPQFIIQLVVPSFASKGASKMLRATGHARMVTQFNTFRVNYRKFYSGNFEVEAKILVVRKYGDFFQKSPNFVPRKHVIIS